MKNQKTKPTNDKDAGLALILIILIIAIATQKISFFIPITILLVLVMTLPIIFRPFSIIWFGLSGFLGHYFFAIILTILFIILVIPISYLRRIFGADILQLKQWKKNEESAFLTTNHKYKPADIEHPF